MIKAIGICRVPVLLSLNTVYPPALLLAPAGPSGAVPPPPSEGTALEKKARHENLPFMRHINSISTPQELSFFFTSPSQACHASNLVAQYRECQAAKDKDAGPPSFTEGKSRDCIWVFFSNSPQGSFSGCHNEPLVAKQCEGLKHHSSQCYHFPECAETVFCWNSEMHPNIFWEVASQGFEQAGKGFFFFFLAHSFPCRCHFTLTQDTLPARSRAKVANLCT